MFPACSRKDAEQGRVVAVGEGGAKSRVEDRVIGRDATPQTPFDS